MKESPCGSVVKKEGRRRWLLANKAAGAYDVVVAFFFWQRTTEPQNHTGYLLVYPLLRYIVYINLCQERKKSSGH